MFSPFRENVFIAFVEAFVLFVFLPCMLLNINFTMEIIKNASLAIFSNMKKLLSIGCSIHIYLLWVEHVCIYDCMMINVYLYLCMFCCCCEKILFIFYGHEIEALYNLVYLPNGFNRSLSTYIRHSSKHAHIFEVTEIYCSKLKLVC